MCAHRSSAPLFARADPRTWRRESESVPSPLRRDREAPDRVCLRVRLVHESVLHQAVCRRCAPRLGVQRRWRCRIRRHRRNHRRWTRGPTRPVPRHLHHRSTSPRSTAALKGFTGGSLGDHDVVGDDLIAAMGITEALGGEADQILGLASQGRDAALARLTTTAPPVSGFRRRLGANDVMWLIVKNDLPGVARPRYGRDLRRDGHQLR